MAARMVLSAADRSELVGRHLFQDEPVERLVLVEGADDVIAIGPGVRITIILPDLLHIALGVGVARHVQPVSAPAFAVMRGGQQAVHHLGKGVRRIVGQKILHLLRGGRQADQIERRAADQRALVRQRIGLHVVGFQLGQNEIVNRGLDPVGFLDLRHRRILDGFEGPMIARRFVLSPSTTPTRGSGAPIFTHASKSAILASESFWPLGGICKSSSV